jgi:hypothetical protein
MSHHSAYPSFRATRKRDRWLPPGVKASGGSYIAAKWRDTPATEASPRFACGRHIVAALLVLIFGVATATAIQSDGRGAESASAVPQQDVDPPRAL